MKSQLTRKQIEAGVGGLVLAITLVLLATTVRHQEERAQAFKAASTQSSQMTVLSASGDEGSATAVVNGQPVELGAGTTSSVTQNGATTTVTSGAKGSTTTTTTTTDPQKAGQAQVNVTVNSTNGNSTSGNSQYTSVNSFTGSYGFQNSGSYHYSNGNVVIDQTR